MFWFFLDNEFDALVQSITIAMPPPTAVDAHVLKELFSVLKQPRFAKIVVHVVPPPPSVYRSYGIVVEQLLEHGSSQLVPKNASGRSIFEVGWNRAAIADAGSKCDATCATNNASNESSEHTAEIKLSRPFICSVLPWTDDVVAAFAAAFTDAASLYLSVVVSFAVPQHSSSPSTSQPRYSRIGTLQDRHGLELCGMDSQERNYEGSAQPLHSYR